MKKLLTTVFSILILGSALLLINGCKQSSDKELNVKEFKSPSSLSSIHFWWHCLDNSITKEWITKDLEAMKKQGISTATIFNAGLFNERDMGIPQVKFNAGEWYQMFEWALKEANRVGIMIGVHNCDGWSNSGGPWIKPENSMKRYVWSKSFITGGKQVKFKLPEPKGNLNFYRDINVRAFPVTSGPSSFQIAKPEIRVNDSSTGNIRYDGNPLSSVGVKNGTTIDIVFQKEFKAIKIAIHPHVEFNWGNLNDIHYQFDLKASSDIKNLLIPGTDTTDAIPSGNIIDLTKYMNSDGILEWEAPQGTWAILRIGYTTTGDVNEPATVAGTGLECDKMDTSALNLHFRNFPAKLIAHSGNFKGNSFEHLLMDSWGCLYQNWTGKFASEFENQRHYSIIKWLPVICRITVDNPEATERFFYDYRKTDFMESFP